MRRLIDTHTLIWAVDNPSQLGPQASTELQEPTNELLLSAGSIWELAIKVGLNKLVLSQRFWDHMDRLEPGMTLAIWKDIITEVIEREAIPLSSVCSELCPLLSCRRTGALVL